MKEIVIKSKNPEQLNEVRRFFNLEIPCYRITEVEVIRYESSTPLEVFINRLLFLPISGVSLIRDYEIKNEGTINGKILNGALFPSYYVLGDIVLLNEGIVDIKIRIEQGKAKDHSCFSTIDSQEWNPEEGILKIVPNTNYEGDEEIISLLDELSKRYPEVKFPNRKEGSTDKRVKSNSK